MSWTFRDKVADFVALVSTLQLFPCTRDATKAYLANKVQERNRGFGFSIWRPLSPAFVASIYRSCSHHRALVILKNRVACASKKSLV